ncbi:MAG: hypothetical protein GY928_16015 [Colwellia sp.]|nr:hypothetical protein [Colwellia sp.]
MSDFSKVFLDLYIKQQRSDTDNDNDDDDDKAQTAMDEDSFDHVCNGYTEHQTALYDRLCQANPNIVHNLQTLTFHFLSSQATKESLTVMYVTNLTNRSHTVFKLSFPTQTRKFIGDF